MTFDSKAAKLSIIGFFPGQTPGLEARGVESALAVSSDGASEATVSLRPPRAISMRRSINANWNKESDLKWIREQRLLSC